MAYWYQRDAEDTIIIELLAFDTAQNYPEIPRYDPKMLAKWRHALNQSTPSALGDVPMPIYVEAKLFETKCCQDKRSALYSQKAVLLTVIINRYREKNKDNQVVNELHKASAKYGRRKHQKGLIAAATEAASSSAGVALTIASNVDTVRGAVVRYSDYYSESVVPVAAFSPYEGNTWTP